MKVLLLNGSIHKNGNTAQALQVVANQLDLEGIESDIFRSGDMFSFKPGAAIAIAIRGGTTASVDVLIRKQDRVFMSER